MKVTAGKLVQFSRQEADRNKEAVKATAVFSASLRADLNTAVFPSASASRLFPNNNGLRVYLEPVSLLSTSSPPRLSQVEPQKWAALCRKSINHLLKGRRYQESRLSFISSSRFKVTRTDSDTSKPAPLCRTQSRNL